MTMADRLTQCREMTPAILAHIEDKERPRQAPAAHATIADSSADEMALAELRDCRELLGEMLARLQHGGRAVHRGR
jgi:lysyl-tRNA synthetase class II